MEPVLVEVDGTGSIFFRAERVHQRRFSCLLHLEGHVLRRTKYAPVYLY
jgi:hypothetical protein